MVEMESKQNYETILYNKTFSGKDKNLTLIQTVLELNKTENKIIYNESVTNFLLFII